MKMKNRTEEEAQLIQDKFDNRKRPVFLFFKEGIEINSLGDVIHELFFTNKTMGTYNRFKTLPERLQRTGRLRSVEDTYLLAHSYLPNITFKQVQLAMDEFVVTSATQKGFIRSFCHTVRRWVHNPLSRYNDQITRKEINSRLDDKNLNVYAKQEVLQEVEAE